MSSGLLEGLIVFEEVEKDVVEPDLLEDAGKDDVGEVSEAVTDQEEDREQDEEAPEVTPEVTPEEQERDISSDVPVSGSTIVYEGDTVVSAVTEVRPILSMPINDYSVTEGLLLMILVVLIFRLAFDAGRRLF